MRFLFKVITVYFKKKQFNYMNNYRYGKSVSFYLDIINKINYKILVIISYISSELRLRKV